MTAPLAPYVVEALEAGWAAAPKEWRDTYNGGTYPALPSISVSGRRFTPAVSPGQMAEASPFTIVTGWVEVVGHYEYDQYTRDGRFLMHFSGDPSIGQFLSAAAIVVGGYAFGTAMTAAGYGLAGGAVEAATAGGTVAGDAFLPAALGVDGGSAFAAAESANFAASMAPWAAGGAAAGSVGSTLATKAAGTAGTAGTSLATKVAGAAASLLGGSQAVGSTAQRQQSNLFGTPSAAPAGTVAGIPMPIILGALALAAFA